MAGIKLSHSAVLVLVTLYGAASLAAVSGQEFVSWPVIDPQTPDTAHLCAGCRLLLLVAWYWLLDACWNSSR